MPAVLHFLQGEADLTLGDDKWRPYRQLGLANQRHGVVSWSPSIGLEITAVRSS
jgi:hypothetical protein